MQPMNILPNSELPDCLGRVGGDKPGVQQPPRSVADLFAAKARIDQAQNDFDETMDQLTRDFGEKFYFRLNKREIFNESVKCSISLNFYIPQALQAPLDKGKHAFHRVVLISYLNFGQWPHTHLIDFEGFEFKSIKSVINDDMALTMLYPGTNSQDISSLSRMPSSLRKTLFEGLIAMEQTPWKTQDFESFCRQMSSRVADTLDEVKVNMQDLTMIHQITPKEKFFILEKLNLAVNHLLQDINTNTNSTHMAPDEWNSLMASCRHLDKARLQERLNNNLTSRISHTTQKKI